MTHATSQIKQPQTDFGFNVRLALLRRGWSVTRLAREIRKSRNNTSIAINHASMFPSIKALITEKLELS